MLESQGFVQAGWVQSLLVYQFCASDCVKFVVKGKVRYSHNVTNIELNM